MKIMVTGGAGFIGSHVVDAYIREGHEVVVIDNLSSGKLEQLNPKAKLYLLDIRSTEMEKVFAIEKPDLINHHAAQKSIPKSVDDPTHDADVNIMGLLNLLQLSVVYKVRKWIMVSSGGALAGDAKTIPTAESVEPVMVSPYAITKYMSEKYLHYYAEIHGLNYTVLRYANVYGPRQMADGECGVVPIFMNNLMKDLPSKLYAYPDMPRGTTRDYIYVDDVIAANLAALTKGDRQVLNIGSGAEIFIEDIYSETEQAMNKSIPLLREKERLGDVKRSALDYSKARELLGWEPKITFPEGILKTVQWISKKA